MAEKLYHVSGMSCGHCAASVTEEVVAVPGVTEVDVDVRAGRVIVRGDSFGEDAVRSAIIEAGFEVAQGARAAAA
ncbi:heavy-metal-associated domain-containing protein [Streptomyces sp. GESEQ-35]|uniref:heavy-metal-associated domain-containing protein n=1 Tax=Streptomyces sp. GESEQ-35 TaxID=2812657 RepID=UPI001B33EB96|nr:heavy-metal-associated domain-containing protein [Streptomyces sp. GESEQ-35]